VKFIVERTSDYGSSSAPPCDGATRQTVNFVRRAPISLRKEESEELWVIEVGNLESLMDFVKQNGNVIISEPYFYELPTLEIHDENPDY